MQGFAHEIAAWLGYTDPQHEAGEVTEVWTDNGHGEEAKVMVFKVFRLELNHGLAAWQPLVDGYSPSHGAATHSSVVQEMQGHKGTEGEIFVSVTENG